MTTATGVNGAWKWLAAILASILITGLPGMIYALRTWSVSSRVDTIQERQDDVRIRLGILETQNGALVAQVAELQIQLREHIQGGKP